MICGGSFHDWNWNLMTRQSFLLRMLITAWLLKTTIIGAFQSESFKKKHALGHSCQRRILKLGPEDDGFASVARSRQF